MADLRLSIALSHYDRHIPLFDGSVLAEGVDLQVLEVGQSNPLKHGQDRHERMLQQGEFVICERAVVLLSPRAALCLYSDSGFSPAAVQLVANVGERRRWNHRAAGFDRQEGWVEHVSDDAVGVGEG